MVLNRTNKCQLLYLLVTFLATGVSTCVLIMTLEVGWITSLDASHLRIITSVFFLPFSICSLPGVKFTGLNLLLFTGHKSKMEGHQIIAQGKLQIKPLENLISSKVICFRRCRSAKTAFWLSYFYCGIFWGFYTFCPNTYQPLSTCSLAFPRRSDSRAWRSV